MTISDWLNEISVKFDELGFVPTTLTDEKSEHFFEWFATEIEMIHKIEETLVNVAGKNGVTQTYIEVLQENSSLRSLLEVSITENAELEKKILELEATLYKKATVEKELKARLDKAVELKAKAGDVLYMPWVYDGESGIAKLHICLIIVDSKTITYAVDFIADLGDAEKGFMKKYKHGQFTPEDFGKIVFTDYIEAEARLAELRGEK